MGEPPSSPLSRLETTSQASAICILDERILSDLKAPRRRGPPRVSRQGLRHGVHRFSHFELVPQRHPLSDSPAVFRLASERRN